MKERETNNLEYKLDITNTFLKTVTAFSNYGGGQVIFGLDDEGKIVGLDKLNEKAFREALANVIVHRNWDVNSSVRVAMFEDKIEIISPGGLPLICALSNNYINIQYLYYNHQR